MLIAVGLEAESLHEVDAGVTGWAAIASPYYLSVDVIDLFSEHDDKIVAR